MNISTLDGRTLEQVLSHGDVSQLLFAVEETWTVIETEDLLNRSVSFLIYDTGRWDSWGYREVKVNGGLLIDDKYIFPGERVLVLSL